VEVGIEVLVGGPRGVTSRWVVESAAARPLGEEGITTNKKNEEDKTDLSVAAI
jgi:hypothetical protein